MNFTGRFDNLMVDLVDNKQKAIFALNEDAKQAFDDLKGCKKLSITIKKYRQKRSLDANSYYWVLITKLAKKISLSNPELHNMDKLKLSKEKQCISQFRIRKKLKGR